MFFFICFFSFLLLFIQPLLETFNKKSNINEIITKATFDIIIGAVGTFGGPVGWVIAGTYFLLDVSGTFGEWGQPSGITQFQLDTRNAQMRDMFGAHPVELDFEIDYCAPLEHTQRELYLEERTIKQDKTNIALPKRIFYNGL